jgi:hypothetical protein
VIEAWAPWVAGLLLAAPVLIAFYPPMTDLPYHEGAIGILRSFSDRSMFPAGLYHYNLGEPNQLFSMVGWALSYAVSTRWAIKLVVASAVVAVPVSAARFARHLGASPLAALVVAPMALGWMFSWGLVANIVGLAALLATLPWIDRLADAPTAARAAAAAGGGVLLYFAHEAMLFVYVGAALGVCVLHARRADLRGTALRLVPAATGAAIAFAQVRWQKRFMTPAVRGMPTFWHPVLHKLARIPGILMPSGDFAVHASMFGLCLFALVSFAWLRTLERRELAGGVAPSTEFGPGGAQALVSPAPLERARRWAIRFRWEIFAAVCFAAYLAFPLTLGGATLVYQRWFPPAFAVAATVLAPRNLRVRRALVTCVAVSVLPVATLLVVWPSFADASRVHRALADLMPYIEPGSAVAPIDLGPGESARTYSLGPAPGRILATRGGRLVYAFTDSPVSPVVLDRKYQWNESLIRVGFDSWGFRPEHDLKRFRYVLVRTTDPALIWLSALVLQPTAEYVAEEGEWLLLRSRMPVVPLLSPDQPLERARPPSMRELIAAAAKRLAEEQPGAPDVVVPPEPAEPSRSRGNPPPL